MDTFTFSDISFSDEDMKDTSLDELRGSLPIFSPLRFARTDQLCQITSQETPRNCRQKFHGGIHKSLSFGDCPAVHPSPSTDVQKAVSRLMNADIIGDGTSKFSLPTVKGKHSDLKSIDCTTLVNLMNGLHQDTVSSYQIIDCRYPYEFNGGHIQGAQNIYTESDIFQFLLNNQSNSQAADIIIFHCEFSSERAPKLCRFLRNKDREMNHDKYPHLTFPELYILDGGYKAFYETYEMICQPRNYIPMLHKDHSADVRHFRSKSKSWTAGEKRKSPQRLLF